MNLAGRAPGRPRPTTRRRAGRSVASASAPGEGWHQAGFISIQYLWVIATSLVLLAMFANVIVMQYGRGVVRSALDEGVRAGARVTAGDELARSTCEDVARAARQDILGGPLGEGVAIRCLVAPDRVIATAEVTFAAFFPAVPSWTFSEDSVAGREELPPAVAP